MRFLVGTRRSGKTTKLLEEMIKHDGDCVYVGNSAEMCRIIRDQCLKILNAKRMAFKTNAHNLVTDLGDKKLYFYTKDQVFSPYKKCSIKKLPKFVDNFEYYLKDMFGDVKYAAATGPNYDGLWDITKNEEHEASLKDYAGHLTEEQYESEFKSHWSDDEQD